MRFLMRVVQGRRSTSQVQTQSPVEYTIADGMGVDMADYGDEYTDVAEMFCELGNLDDGSVEFGHQRDRIIQRCLPLAEHIARRYGGRGEPHDDLVQAARMGLVNAVNRFDSAKGTDFLSYAVPTMMGEVRRYFRDYGWAVKVPRRVKDLQAQLNRARADLSQQLGRAPNASEVAKHLGLDRDVVVEATIAGNHYSAVSSDVPAGDDDGYRPLGETLGSIDPGLDHVLNVETVRPLIAALPDRERTVLRLRFFENLTQTQIAEQIGCSQMHVSRLITKAINTLRTQAGEPELKARERRLAASA
jgi:RNA polymerase sigma-B factor